jgi:hypothetical protein
MVIAAGTVRRRLHQRGLTTRTSPKQPGQVSRDDQHINNIPKCTRSIATPPAPVRGYVSYRHGHEFALPFDVEQGDLKARKRPRTAHGDEHHQGLDAAAPGQALNEVMGELADG